MNKAFMLDKTNHTLSPDQSKQILKTLKNRFENNMHRHHDLQWTALQARLEKNHEKLWSLYQMETTGGEPDCIEYDQETDHYILCDCSVESPKGRRSLCYDRKARGSRKEHKPLSSAQDIADSMGIHILSEGEYRNLQTMGEFDTKTSSRIQTPTEIRSRGGALFCDRRYDHVFMYHNGAESYYAARGFRGLLKV